MQYKFTQGRENYEMYAGGGVIYAQAGHTAFPIRLANEVFRRCVAFRESQGAAERCVLYDPCCGSGYLLTTLAYFNWDSIARIIASDINADAVALAERNLSLLRPHGLERRIDELAEMHTRFGKESHALALQHARQLHRQLTAFLRHHHIPTDVFHADGTDAAQVDSALNGTSPDVVIADIPYGWHEKWSAESRALAENADPVDAMLESLLPVLAAKAVIAIASDKTVKVHHPRFRRLNKFKVGKRQLVILTPL